MNKIHAVKNIINCCEDKPMHRLTVMVLTWS